MTGSETMWTVKVGVIDFLIEEFQKKNIVAIGWGEIGDLSDVKDGAEIKKLVKETYPDLTALSHTARQIRRFRFDFQQGDKVISYDRNKRVYLIGEILSDYKFAPDVCEFPHVRDVKWLGEVEMDKISASTMNALMFPAAIYKLSEDATEELVLLLASR